VTLFFLNYYISNLSLFTNSSKYLDFHNSNNSSYNIDFLPKAKGRLFFNKTFNGVSKCKNEYSFGLSQLNDTLLIDFKYTKRYKFCIETFIVIS